MSSHEDATPASAPFPDPTSTGAERVAYHRLAHLR